MAMENLQSQYLQQTIKMASPEEIISKLYDLAVQATYKRDEKKVGEVLDVLMKSLNFEYEIAGTMYELYAYCKEISSQQKFDEIRELLTPLREAWNESVLKRVDYKESMKRVNSTGFLA